LAQLVEHEHIAKVKKLPAPSSPERKKALREILLDFLLFQINLTKSIAMMILICREIAFKRGSSQKMVHFFTS